MRIHDHHLNLGAALAQIAEHAAFSALTVFEYDGEHSKCAYRINDRTGAYIKYSTAPTVKDPNRERNYVFFVEQPDLNQFAALQRVCEDVFLVLVCVSEKDICVLSARELRRRVELRQRALGYPEEYYRIIVTAEANKQFYVNVQNPDGDGEKTGSIRVSRKAFPDVLFSE
jgi:hypothetical protein